MMELCLFVIGACAHRFRGQEGNLFKISDRFFAILCFGAVFYLAYMNPVFPIITMVGYLVFLSAGHGSYFTDPMDFELYNTEFHMQREKEISWIDWIITHVSKNFIWQNFWGMTLRGLYFMPAFFAMGYYCNNQSAFIYGFVFAITMGLAYLIMPLIAYKFKYYDFEYTGFAEGVVGGTALVLLSLATGS